MSQHLPLYTKWSAVLKEKYGERVQKISLDIGAGCPHRDGLVNGGCIFCDARGGGSGAWLESVELEEQISRGVHVALHRYHARKTILYFQSYTSTNLPLPILKERVENAIDMAAQKTEVVGVALGTRPDMVPDEFLDFLVTLYEKGYEVWLELGVQTINEEGLKWLNRGHGLKPVEDTLKRASLLPIFTCAHLISGLKGEKREQLALSAKWLVEKGITALKFHPLHVLKGTLLEKYFLDGTYLPLEMTEYALRVAHAITNVPPSVIIQRLTADARYPWLVAPEWILQKNAVIHEIEMDLCRFADEQKKS